jgi:hypothetical protein
MRSQVPKSSLPPRDGDDDAPPEHLALQVRVGVVLASEVVLPLRDGLVRREALEPLREVGVQARARRSLMNTLDVMCIEFRGTNPSRIPLFASARSTSSVMFTNARRFGTSSQSSSR